MKLIFEKGTPGRHCHLLPDYDVPVHEIGIGRERKLSLPELSENEISKHYTGPAGRAHGVNDGFYPLGSCTMKYNPKVNEEVVSLEGFAGIHPLQPEHTVQSILRVFGLTEKYLCGITDVEAMTFRPTAGAHGEFMGLLLMKVYHHFRGDKKRTKIIVPDSAHGTNPAGVAMVDYSIVSTPSREDGYVDLDKLKEVVGEDTADLMLTSPNIVGFFDKNILEITRTAHETGKLCYYDRANLNAVMGIVRPGDMGLDVVHLSLHKILSTPHDGGGPGSDPVDCKKFLRPFPPGFMVKALEEEKGCGASNSVKEPESIGRVKMFYGNFGVVAEALPYIMALGREGTPETSSNAVLNASYMMNKLSDLYRMAYNKTCVYEFVTTPEDLEHNINVSVVNIAKVLPDYGIHPPTMYLPPIVHEAPMVEPAETESRETPDQAIEVFRNIYEAVKADLESLYQAPVKTAVHRLGEVTAARRPVLRYMGEQEQATDLRDNTGSAQERVGRDSGVLAAIGGKMADRFDPVIIGAGSGGYVATIKNARLGLTAAVVENREVGGTCLSRGCTPVKTMIHAPQSYRETKEGGQFGIFAESVRYEYDKILEYKEGTSESLRQGVEQLFEANGVTLVKGTGALQVDRTVPMTGCGGEEESRVLKGKRMLLISGSRPVNLPIQRLDLFGVLINDRLFELKCAPESLLIISGGVIGAEFASVFPFLGIRVTIAEVLSRSLANLDKDTSQNLKMILKKHGIKIYTGVTVKRIGETKHGLACVFEEKGEEKREEADYVLSVAGRVSETEKLLGPGTELAMEWGRIMVDFNFETFMEGVYAIGDVIKGIRLVYVASAQGAWMAKHLVGIGHSIDLSIIPSCVYTSPEIASAELTEDEVAQAGIPVSVGKFLMSANGKSQIPREERGFIKIIAEADTKVVLGVQMICARVTDMIGEMATVAANKLTAPQLPLGMYAHLTYSKTVGEAPGELEGGSIHTVPRQAPGRLRGKR